MYYFRNLMTSITLTLIVMISIFCIYDVYAQESTQSQAETVNNERPNTQQQQRTSAKTQLDTAFASVTKAKTNIEEFLAKNRELKSEQEIQGYFDELIKAMEDLVKQLSETSDFMDAINKLKLRYEKNVSDDEKQAKSLDESSRKKIEANIKKNREAAKREEERKIRISSVRKDFEQRIIDLTQEELNLLRKVRDEELDEISKFLDNVEKSINTALGDVDVLLIKGDTGHMSGG